MIERNEYLNVLKRFKDKELIKVITGLRRCGKSTLLDMYKEYLLNNGIVENQIININLEDLKYNFITDYMSLYNYINDSLQSDKKNYVFIDEVKKIDDNYEKIILTADKIPLSNEEGIKIMNVLEWLLDK